MVQNLNDFQGPLYFCGHGLVTCVKQPLVRAMIGENRQLVADEPIEFAK